MHRTRKTGNKVSVFHVCKDDTHEKKHKGEDIEIYIDPEIQPKSIVAHVDVGEDAWSIIATKIQSKL
jgi:hypothetical protein